MGVAMTGVAHRAVASPRARIKAAVAAVFILAAQWGLAKDAPQEAVFYPPAPDQPRLQHLVTLGGERDLAEAKSGFAAFILGEEPQSQQLVQPYGMAMDRGRLYVADTGAGGLAIFDLANKKFSLWQGAGEGRMKRPINIRIDGDGTRYVTDTQRDQVLVYDKTDRFVAAFGAAGQFRPVDVAIRGERLFVTDLKNHQVHILDKRSGKSLGVFGKPGSADGELFHPTNIAVAPNGDLLVADTSNYRIQRFTAEGAFVRSYGTVGNGPGSFARPKGIAVDQTGRMYVGDAAFENVQVFDGAGQLLLYFGQPSDSFEGLTLPAGVAIDYQNLEFFKRYAKPGFAMDYLVFVSSQFGPNKVDVFAFGKLAGVDYPVEGQEPGGGAQ